MGTLRGSRRLELETRNDREVAMTRLLNELPPKVYEAWTQPEQVARWYGPFGWTITVCQIDLRVGGGWRYVLKGADETLVAMSGNYREVVRNERLVSTESVEGTAGESVNTVTFEEQEGLTRLTAVVLYESHDARDAVFASGMELGAGASFDRLDQFLSRRRS